MTVVTKETGINGINVSALNQTIEAIKHDPSKAQTQWKVKSSWEDGTLTQHRVDGFGFGGEQIHREFKIQIDEPYELCGSNRFANPQEYLLAATNACMMVGYSAVAALMGIKLTKLEIEIEGDIDLRGFLGLSDSVSAGYEKLHYKVHLAGEGTDEQLEEIHAIVKRTSPNYYNISQPVAISSELIIES